MKSYKYLSKPYEKYGYTNKKKPNNWILLVLFLILVLLIKNLIINK